jgi:hypothetical protein
MVFIVQGKEWVLCAYFELQCICIIQPVKLFQCTFEVGRTAEELRSDACIFELEIDVQSVSGFVGIHV